MSIEKTFTGTFIKWKICEIMEKLTIRYQINKSKRKYERKRERQSVDILIYIDILIYYMIIYYIIIWK